MVEVEFHPALDAAPEAIAAKLREMVAANVGLVCGISKPGLLLIAAMLDESAADRALKGGGKRTEYHWHGIAQFEDFTQRVIRIEQARTENVVTLVTALLTFALAAGLGLCLGRLIGVS